MVVVKLLEEEQGWFQMTFISPTVASFYQTDESSEKFTQVKDGLVNRITEVLKANPWLCGRLIKEKIDGKHNICLSFAEEITNPLDYIHTICDDKLFTLKEWKSICEFLSSSLAKKSTHCVDKDEPLCKFLIYENTALTELALVLSMNHSIGDGYTLYYIWKMLDEHEDIISMSVERVYKYMDYVKRDTNLGSCMVGKTDALKMIFRGISRTVCRKAPPRTNIYKVNSDFISRRKAECNSGDVFVSTNDILTTWLLGKEVCHSDSVVMAINLRNRIPELSENLAGNYEIFGPISLPESDSPIDFRENWKGVMSKKLLPAAKSGFNGTNNWGTFFHQIDLDGFKHCFHIPIYDEVSIKIAGVPIVPECGAIIFKINRDEFAIILTVYNDLPDSLFDDCEILVGKILS